MQTNRIKKIYLVILVGCFIISCGEKNEIETFVVSKSDRTASQGTSTAIPPMPNATKAYYFPANIIIDSFGQFFYYQQNINWNNDAQAASNLPAFIGLKPADIIQIPVSSIEEFIKLNVLDKDTLKRYVAIISEKDTIQSEGLSRIMALCKNQSNHIRWIFRLPTLEEAIVLGYRKRWQYYSPGAIKWDSTKIQMPSADN